MTEKVVAVFPIELKDKFQQFIKENELEEPVYQEMNLKGIKNPLAFIQAQWCLATLGEKIKQFQVAFADVDGYLGYFNNFLFLEFKKNADALNAVQMSPMVQLVTKLEGTLLTAFGTNCNPTHYFEVSPRFPKGSDLFRTNQDHFQTVIQNWLQVIAKKSIQDELEWNKTRKLVEELISKIKSQYAKSL